MPNLNVTDPGKSVLSLFDQLIASIKSSQPAQTNGKGLTTGFVYSQLVLGMPCDPDDYMNAWSPAGGGTVQDSFPPTPTTTPPGGTPPAPPAPGGTPTASPTPSANPQLQAALNAAWK